MSYKIPAAVKIFLNKSVHKNILKSVKAIKPTCNLVLVFFANLQEVQRSQVRRFEGTRAQSTRKV